MSDSVRPHRWQPTRLPRSLGSPGKNTGVGCHFLLQCLKVQSESESLSHVRLLATPWTAAYQAPPSMGFSKQEHWSGVPLPSPFPFIQPYKIKIWHRHSWNFIGPQSPYFYENNTPWLLPVSPFKTRISVFVLAYIFFHLCGQKTTTHYFHIP